MTIIHTRNTKKSRRSCTKPRSQKSACQTLRSVTCDVDSMRRMESVHASTVASE